VLEFEKFVERNAAVDATCRKHSSLQLNVVLPLLEICAAQHWYSFEELQLLEKGMVPMFAESPKVNYTRLMPRLHLKFHTHSALINAIEATHYCPALSPDPGHGVGGDTLMENHNRDINEIMPNGIHAESFNDQMRTRNMNLQLKRLLLDVVAKKVRISPASYFFLDPLWYPPLSTFAALFTPPAGPLHTFADRPLPTP